MLIPPLNHRDITGVVKRAVECLKPLEHLRPFDAGDAKPFVTARQLEGVLSGDNTGAELPAAGATYQRNRRQGDGRYPYPGAKLQG